MARKTASDRMTWFKMDAGAFMTDTGGLSNAHAGIYCKLMCMYWQGGNSLALPPEILKRRLGITESKDEAILEEILSEFFYSLDDYLKHIRLDAQLKEVTDNSALQSARASKPRTSRGALSANLDNRTQYASMEVDEDNF